VWATDFHFDQTADGHNLKLLHVVDEFTREAWAIECRRRIDADHTVKVLDRLVAERGSAPTLLRCDNGPEMTATRCGTGAGSRRPAARASSRAPWQNPFVESFGRRVRDELLSVELFSRLAEARVLIEGWRIDDNHHRPHSALGMTTPHQFAIGCREAYLAAASASVERTRPTASLRSTPAAA
jgi:transposase InsO family protein